MRFYLVDDDPDIIALVRAVLEQAGHSVDSSTSSVQALKEIVARRPDCVVTDVMMPEMDGFELTRELRLTIPPEVPPGRLLLQVGDASALARTDPEAADEFVPRDLRQLIWLINHLRRNDRLYAVLVRADNGLVFQVR